MRGNAVLSESCVRILKPCREVRSMTSRPPTNVPASVHQRLLNLARQTNRPFNELLQYFAIQRFLFRFSRSEYPEQFVLKASTDAPGMGCSAGATYDGHRHAAASFKHR